MTKTERARYNKLMDIAIYFGVKVIYKPLEGTYEDIRDKECVEKERKRFVRAEIETKLPPLRTRLVFKKPNPLPPAEEKPKRKVK